jgi:hypothetical protein
MPRQVGYAHTILGEITGQDQCLLELQIIVLFVEALVLLVFALEEGVECGYLNKKRN